MFLIKLIINKLKEIDGRKIAIGGFFALVVCAFFLLSEHPNIYTADKEDSFFIYYWTVLMLIVGGFWERLNIFGDGYRSIPGIFKQPYLSYLYGSFIIVIILLGFEFYTLPGESGIDKFFQMHKIQPTGIFSLFVGILTVFGLSFTIVSLQDIKRNIFSFKDLLERLEKMISEATIKDPVRILCYTPALGFIARPEEETNRLYKCFTDIKEGKTVAVELICLNDEDLNSWHSSFKGRETKRKKVIDEEIVKSANMKSKIIVEAIQKSWSRYHNPRERKIKRLSYQTMPGYYLYFRNHQALIVTPLFLPAGIGSPTGQKHNVEMIGFETNDHRLIEELKDIYDFYKRIPENCTGEEFFELKGRNDIEKVLDSIFKEGTAKKLLSRYENLMGDGSLCENIDSNKCSISVSSKIVSHRLDSL